MTVDSVEEVVDDALDVPILQPQIDTSLIIQAAPISNEEPIPTTNIT